MKKILAALFIFFNISVLANDELVSEFKDIYAQYQEANELLATIPSTKATYNKQAQVVLSKAQRAYELGAELFPAGSDNSINLASNYAHAALEALEPKKAISIFLEWVKTLKKHTGDNDQLLLLPYQGLGKAYAQSFKPQRSTRFFDKALETTARLSGNNSLHYAQALLNTGEQLTNNGYGKYGEQYLEQANSLFRQHQDAREVITTLYLGKVKLQKKNHAEAAPYFEGVVSMLDTKKQHPFALSARAFLVNAYEQMGQQNKATQHCVEIGRLTPWVDSREAKPLYQKMPVYPLEAQKAGKSGYVTVELKITPTGFVKEPVIIAGKNKRFFSKSAIDAIKHFRFAPKFENGEAVEAKATYRMIFKIQK